MPTDPPALAAALADWFREHGRSLPWRENRTPYRVWVSEVMLQQTRVDTVLRYYEPFLERFPDLGTLAAADASDVLKAWQGLGYYQRAQRMHRAAQLVVDRYGGVLPGTAEELSALPGFGPYTAKAVTAFAFGRAHVAVDANVRRVGARWLGQAKADDPAIAAAFADIARHADQPGRVGEALVEVGALVCTPRDPGCHACPLRGDCRARASGQPESFPAPTVRRAPREVRRNACLRVDPDGLWLHQRPRGGLLGGLWGVPQTDDDVHGTPVGRVRHAYSHLRLELDVVAIDSATIDGADPLPPGSEHVPWARLADLPVSVVDLKIFALARDADLLPADADAALRGTMPT